MPPIPPPEKDEQLPPEVLAEVEKAMAPFLGQVLTQGTLVRLKSAVYDASVRIRNRGFQFPKVVPVVLRHRGYIHFARADLSNDSIQRVIIMLIKRFPNVTVPELVEAIHFAWPNYRRDAVMGEHDRMAKLITPTTRVH